MNTGRGQWPRRGSCEYREAVLPGPERGSGYQKVLFVGPTGSGKTSLLRRLAGTEANGFPAVSVARTTVAETDVLLAPGEFYAVATFLSEDEVVACVQDCAIRALDAICAGRPDVAVQRALLSHTDQRFNLRHLLGPAEHAYGSDLAASEWLVSTLGALRRVGAKIDNSQPDPRPSIAALVRTDLDAIELVTAIMHRISARFDLIELGELVRTRGGWPGAWHFSTSDRATMFEALAPLTSNFDEDFGRLLTPLVDGLRVRGPFHPGWSPEIPYLMLTDTEGLGHTPDTASALPDYILDAADRADRIVIVDNGANPAQAATGAALRGLTEAGHTSKLSVCFTHVDEVLGPNLSTDSARRDFLRSCLEQVIDAAADELGPETRRALEHRLDEEVYFIGCPDLAGGVGPAADPCVAALRRFLRSLRVDTAPVVLPGQRPVYRRDQLVAAVEAGVTAFRNDALARAGGTGRPRRKRLWRSVAGRVRHDRSKSYQPDAELARIVIAAVRAGAERPAAWHGDPLVGSAVVEVIDLFIRTARPRLRVLATESLCGPQMLDWDAVAAGLGFGSDELGRMRSVLDRQLGLDFRVGFVASACDLIETAAGESGILLIEGDSDLSALDRRQRASLPRPDFAASGAIEDVDGTHSTVSTERDSAVSVWGRVG